MRKDALRVFSALGIASLALAHSGCSGSSEPAIWDLQYDAPTFFVGETDSMSGSFEFEALDGDLDILVIEIEIPLEPHEDEGTDREVVTLPPSALDSAEGEERGTLDWAFFFEAEVPGRHDFRLFVVDEDERESNRLEGSFDAEL